MDVNEILAGLKVFDGKYKRELVEAAISKKEGITPYLIEILEQVVRNPYEYTDEQENDVYIYALMLLGHFQEPKAHQVILDLFSLPDELPDSLFGDIITESLPIILLRTCGESVEGIKSLILNKNAYEFCRSSAIIALSYAVVEGVSAREDALSFFGDLFKGDEAPEDSYFYSQMVCSICDLQPASLADTINDAFDRGLVDEMFVSRSEFQEVLESSEEDCLARLSNEIAAASLDEIHKNMEWWASYEPEEIEEPFVRQPSVEQFWSQPKPKSKKKKAFWEL